MGERRRSLATGGNDVVGGVRLGLTHGAHAPAMAAHVLKGSDTEKNRQLLPWSDMMMDLLSIH